MPKKRDSAYYRRRLKRDHPAIYADLLAGRIPSVRAAAARAGLIRLPGPLDVLKRAWRGVTIDEKKAFLLFARPPTASATRAGSIPVFDADNRLLKSTITRIEAIIAARKLSKRDVMKELGFTPLDASLWMAMGGTRVRQPALRKALEEWLKKHSP